MAAPRPCGCGARPGSRTAAGAGRFGRDADRARAGDRGACRDRSVQQRIARTIGISDGTVRIHLSKIYQKLGISNRTALATHESLEDQPSPIPEKPREVA